MLLLTFVFIIFFAFLLLSLYLHISLLYPLLLGLAGFVLLALQRGYSLSSLSKMMMHGCRQSLIVIRIFVLIGAITAVWRACGTIPYIVFHGIALINEQFFILSAFILSCLVSFLLGTSFGTVGTLGVALMVLARSGQVNVDVAAGAIIAGAYFGDRCSPMSSSANLVAALTRTQLYLNLSNMLKTSVLPFVLACLGYAALSWQHPLVASDSPILTAIPQAFSLQPIVILPAVLILLMASAKIDVKLSMGVSILAGVVIALTVQNVHWFDLLAYTVTGYRMNQPGFLADILQGGGLLSMLQVALIVLISSAYSGLFAGTGMLSDIESGCEQLSNKIGVFTGTMITSVVAAAFSCNQTLAVMLTHQLTKRIYEKKRLGNYRLALDLENTVIMIAALIPWNIAGAVPAAALATDAGFIPYALYLYLIPLTSFFCQKAKIKSDDNNAAKF